RGGEDGRGRHHPRRLRGPGPRAQDPSAGLHLLDADPARPLRQPGHARRALRQEGGAPGRELRDRQVRDHPEDDGRARHPGRDRRAAAGLRLRPRGEALSVRPEEGPGAPGSGRLPERGRHHAPQLVGGVPPGVRGNGRDADRGRHPNAPAQLHPPYHTEPGGRSGKWFTRVEGLDKLIDEARSTVDQPKRKRIYAQIQQIIREEAPSIFLWTQYDTLGISKKVQYAARPDEWLWLYDAKPAAR